MHHRLLPHRRPQLFITHADDAIGLFHRVLRDCSLRQPHTGQLFQNRGRFPDWHSVPKVQNVRQRFDSRSHAMRRGSLLSRGNIGMAPSHGFSALPASARFDNVSAHLDTPLDRHIREGNNLFGGFTQGSAAIRATTLGRYADSFRSGRFRLLSKTEESLARFAPRRFGV